MVFHGLFFPFSVRGGVGVACFQVSATMCVLMAARLHVSSPAVARAEVPGIPAPWGGVGRGACLAGAAPPCPRPAVACGRQR